MPLGKPKIYTV